MNNETKIKTHFEGDEAEYTGAVQELFGDTAYELLVLEGHCKGLKVWTFRLPKIS